ncbi:MAG: xylose isomerase [Verrucomicrobiales bacterium]|nr:xylose isomerase [Verrucomicrobiales bacterium]|tara:strand:+ start:4480 stop:5385 length:906 start_codon:yes stop_codon:yes gene_type:complete
MHCTTTRRDFIRAAAATAAVTALPNQLLAAKADLNGRIFKTLKIGMIRVKGSLTDKFKAAKAAGFEGVELNAPGINVKDAIAASKAAQLPIDGTVNAGHWQVRHTDADKAVRANALKSLKDGLIQTREIGGHTLLLVVGHGKDGDEKDIWDRSIENISKAVPLAAELGVTIAIENVWNHFCYDHSGDSDQSVEKFVKYVDAFGSPWVGMQFDLGNHWKYGATGDWVRKLGKRIVKLDIKGFSREESKFKKIGEGDVDWKDVSKALYEINFHGWCAAEVGGGGPERLEEVVANMNKVFGLKG